MKCYGVTKEKWRADRIKWICPKMKYRKGWFCNCNKPCSTTSHGRTTYTYEIMDLRMFPGIQRNTKNGMTLIKYDSCRTCPQSFQSQYVHRRKENQKSHYHESRCVPGWHRQSTDCHRCSDHELSTIHPKLKTTHFPKKYSIVKLLI